MVEQVQVLVERWRHEYNTFRPHSALGYRPLAAKAIEPKAALGVILVLKPGEGQSKRLSPTIIVPC